jgi:hypothetical protein
VRILGEVVDGGPDLGVGTAVELVWHDAGDDVVLPAWKQVVT